MTKKLWLHAAVLSLSAGLTIPGAAFGQGIPAEVPPTSYSADQYIDSRGCVFVRVGFGAATEWVPRVGRSRQQVCGQAPTNVGNRNAPDLTADSGVTIIGGPAPATGPAPAVVVAPVIAAAPAPVRTPAPQIRVVTAPAPATVVAPAASGCPNLPAAHQPYFTGADVRCGPQENFPGTVGPQSSLGGTSIATGTARSFALSAPPPGYELAWDDGRLNPYRGLGTAAGEAQMQQVWTNTVPRRIASVPIGTTTRVLTRRQAAADALNASLIEASGGDRGPRARLPIADQPAAPSNEVRVGSSHRHVLAGTFSGQADASNAYNRLASAGLPARIGQIQRQGQTLFVVMAGPYGDPQSLGRALVQTRGAGFSGAITRN